MSLIVFIVLCFYAGWIGQTFTASSIDVWYPLLNKPSFCPPNWVFAPAWSILYFLMAVAAWLVWKKRKVVDVRLAIAWFAVQLMLNICWTAFFFGLRWPDGALVEIIVLWNVIVWTTFRFSQIDRRAAFFLLPYLGWVAFAAVLNFEFWRLN